MTSQNSQAHFKNLVDVSRKENLVFLIKLLKILVILNFLKIFQRKPKVQGADRLQMFCKLGVLKNFANFTKKHMYRCPFLIKSQVFRPVGNVSHHFHWVTLLPDSYK